MNRPHTTLPRSLAAYGSPDFARTLKDELSQLDKGTLPLQQGLRHGSAILDDTPELLLLDHRQDGQTIRIRTGIFFNSIIAGCSCADDPTPVDKLTEYFEVDIVIERDTAAARFLPAVE